MSADGKTYWRSLEQLADDPRTREFLEREFPEGASEPPENVTRRTMLTLLGASISMAGLTACRRPVEKIVPYVNAPENVIPGVPLHYATTMPAGLGALGLVVESHEGRPTKIEGNELHPSTLGGSNALVQASILGLYDPDRAKAVVHGETRKSWEEFVAAWAEIEKAFLENGGRGLAVLTRPFSSPTLARLAEAFRGRFPEARFAAWEPVSDENLYAGVERATGSALQPVYHFDRASVILSLDSDFLLTESENVRHSRGFADGRRISGTGDSMSRLYAVESVLSLTGGNADHRLRLQSGQVGVFAAALAARMGVASGAAEAFAAGDAAKFLEALAHDLEAAHGKSLIVAGRRQPPAVHAAALALNEALGNVGSTVTFHEMPDAAPSRRDDLASLVKNMRDGAVTCLVVLGGNPAYDAPADLDFSGAAGSVEQVVHLGAYADETSELAAWRLPQAHFLESWGDARAVGGVPSVIQPLIAPLFGGVSPVEVLGLLATGVATTGHEIVRQTWGSLVGGGDKGWNRVLHDGLYADGATSPVRPSIGRDACAELARDTAAAKPASASALEVVFQSSPAVFDGSHANNGWLQELPDPVTKLTWDNAALLSPATAAELGLANEDVAVLSLDGREMETAVWIVPGQADHSVTLTLGYGRRAAGRVGDGRGFDTYALRTTSAMDIGRGLGVTTAGRRYSLAQTQDHGSMEGRPVVREGSLERFRKHPTFAKDMVHTPPLESLFEEKSYDAGYQWGMTIDLTACTGCNACVMACQSENNIPIVGKEQLAEGREMHWLRIDRYFNGETADPQTVFQPVPCMHCENAPCETVCPVAATVHDDEGLNTMVYNRCIGTRYCSNNCPYKVRRFNYFNFTKDTPEVQKMAHNPDVTVRSRGVMEKCTYCTQRINAARIDAKLAGRELADGDVTTACEQACPTRAITFGNIRDADSRVSKMKSQERDYVLIPGLNNKPRTSYLAKLRNPSPALAGAAPETEEHH